MEAPLLAHCPDSERFVENEVLEYQMDLDAPPQRVLDIGAHAGAFTALCLKRWPTARFTAVEPHPENARLYRENFPGPNFCLLESAARDFEGDAEMHLGLNSATHSFHQLGSQNGHTIKVHCLDAATLPAADLIKVDTEGCEVEIIQRLDLSEARAIIVEYHRAEDERALRRYLKSKGFYLHEKRPHGDRAGILKWTRKIQEGRLFIATPMYAAPNPFFAQALISVLSDPPCHIMYRQSVGDSPVGRSRNILTYEFLESDCSDILFIDCDLIFSHEHVGRILSHKEEIVGGLYPKKQPKLEWVVNTWNEQKVREDGLWDVRYVGTGFVRIKRTVFDQMIARWGEEIRYTADNGLGRDEYNLWPIGVYNYPNGFRRYLSEDWYFCQRWLDLGGKVWADTKIVIKHAGYAVYPMENPFVPAQPAQANDAGAGTASSRTGVPAS